MEDEKEDEQKGKANLLPGQMCYDELLGMKSGPVEEENQSFETIEGQVCFDDFFSNKPPIYDTKERNAVEKTIGNHNVDTTETKIHAKTENEELKDFDEDEIQDKIKAEILEDQRDESESDEETIEPPHKGGDDGIIEKSLDEVLHDSMIPYTECVVLDRALPRVEDGLKPVQRRILYSMMELGVTPDKPYRKSARIVGDCMGKYHPHGDSSVYDAMVRMSQNFSMSAPLVLGHGNFGSVDGDGAAAMRYTEAKLQPLAMELLRDLEKNTVRWTLNFDDTLKEPDILPGRFPNLLVNGASGIAVGLATNIPPHNLSEVIDGTVAYIDNPKITLEEMMKHIKAPDFPTGGLITAGEEVENAYRTGKGKLVIRSKIHLESKGDKKELVITEIPYMANKAAILQKIVEIKNNSKNPLADVAEIRDESDRSGMRAVIRLKKEANPKQVLEHLYKSTNLQTSFAINIVAIADGKPKQMGLLDIISYYVEYQREIIYRRTKFDLDQAKDRAHIVEGLLVAIKNIDEVIRIIKKSSTSNEAKSKLRERFVLSDKQAQAILDMRLARLVNLEVEKLENELAELKKLIKELMEIVGSKKLQFSIVKTELLEIKKKFGCERRSEIIKSLEIKTVKEEDDTPVGKTCYVGVSAENTVKLIQPKNYSMAMKEISDTTSKTDIHKILLETKTDKKVLIFLDNGYCVKTDVSKIPEAKWRDKGTVLKTIEANAPKECQVVSVLEIPDNFEGLQILFMTKCGNIKKTDFSEYVINKGYFQAIKLKDSDSVLAVETSVDANSVVMVSSLGMTLNMSKTDVPVQGRISSGVIGINLDEKDFVVFAGQVCGNDELVVMTDKGFVKKVAVSEFETMPRNRKGLRIINLSENGKLLVYATKFDANEFIAVETANGYISILTKTLMADARYSKGTQKINKKIISVNKYIK